MALADAGIDALAVPTTPIPAPLIGEESTRVGGKDHSTRALLLRLNRPANLAGVPAIVKPATQTCYLAERMFRDIIESGIFPEGSLQLICGSVGDLFDHLDHDLKVLARKGYYAPKGSRG